MTTWDNTFEGLPSDSTYVFELDNKIRELKSAVRERFSKEHCWKTTTDGQHIVGKVRCLLVDTKTNILSYSGNLGVLAYATDTHEFYRCLGGLNWSLIQFDHGDFVGLTDDDHLIYLLANGDRYLTGNLDLNNNKIVNLKNPELNVDCANKKYVDDSIADYTQYGFDINGNYATSATLKTANAWHTVISTDIVIPSGDVEVYVAGYFVGEGYFSDVITQLSIRITCGSNVLANSEGFRTKLGELVMNSISSGKNVLNEGTQTINLQSYGTPWAYYIYQRSINAIVFKYS